MRPGHRARLTLMGRVALLGVAVGLVVVVASCGGGSKPYTLARTKSCLVERGAHIGGKLDFVAQTATGGAFVTRLGDNFVAVVFGQTLTDGKQIELAYQRFAFSNVRAGLAELLRRYNNVVTLWHLVPSSSDRALIVGCLR